MLADLRYRNGGDRLKTMGPKTRRQFLQQTSLGLAAVAVGCNSEKQAAPAAKPATPAELPPGAPGAFATAPETGPTVSAATFFEAEKLVQVTLSDAERAQAAGSWRSAMAPLYELRVGPKKLALEATLAPATEWNPVLPGEEAGPARDVFIRSAALLIDGDLPKDDEDIAFAPVTKLSHWVQQKKNYVTASDADISRPVAEV